MELLALMMGPVACRESSQFEKRINYCVQLKAVAALLPGAPLIAGHLLF